MAGLTQYGVVLLVSSDQVTPAGVPSAAMLGGPAALLGPIVSAPSAIAPAASLGTLEVAVEPLTVAPAGAGPAEAWGTLTLLPGGLVLAVAGMPSSAGVGVPTVGVPVTRWPNVERAVVAWLAARLGGAPVYTETPPSDLPAERVVVARAGGRGGELDLDVDVDVVVLSATRSGMWALASAVESAMRELAAAGSPYVDDVAVRAAFGVEPTPAHRRRAAATFTLTVRPTSS